MRVYPRVCGETASGWSIRAVHVGLSPRVRGNHVGQGGLADAGGSIPACAGKPKCTASCATMERVYPRVCGETESLSRVSIPASGLSPRVRGNQWHIPCHQIEPGSIPACAGKPQGTRGTRRFLRVYPRVCGETEGPNTSIQPPTGLSPRVRGNRVILRGPEPGDGSIPACAGKPLPFAFTYILVRVYPRVCGETAGARGSSRTGKGLSPRVRGNLRKSSRGLRCPRSIPACAGKPSPRTSRKAGRRVYPRVCGETFANGHLEAIR